MDLIRKLTETAAEASHPKLESCSWDEVERLAIEKRVELLGVEHPAGVMFLDGPSDQPGFAWMDDGSKRRRIPDQVVQAMVSDAPLVQAAMADIDADGDVLFWEDGVPVLKYNYRPAPFTGELQTFEAGKWHRGTSVVDGLPPKPKRS